MLQISTPKGTITLGAIARAIAEIVTEETKKQQAQITIALGELRTEQAERRATFLELCELLRTRAIELRDGVPGPQGDKGERGDKGDKGDKGDPGEPGPAGADGAAGRDGAPGEQGPAGDKGDKGEQGDRGADGAPGEPGPAGADGAKGDRGERGEKGEQGSFAAPVEWSALRVFYGGELVFHKGSTFCARKDTAAEPPHEDWAPVALAGVDGATCEFMGLYDPKATYRKLNLVTLDGSTWLARRDNPGELPGEGWALAARAGSRGRPGDRGKEGERGPAGPSGATLIEAQIVDYQLILTTSDQRSIVCDLRGMLRTFADEVLT